MTAPVLTAPRSSALRRASMRRSVPAWSNISMVPSSCRARSRQIASRDVLGEGQRAPEGLPSRAEIVDALDATEQFEGMTADVGARMLRGDHAIGEAAGPADVVVCEGDFGLRGSPRGRSERGGGGPRACPWRRQGARQRPPIGCRPPLRGPAAGVSPRAWWRPHHPDRAGRSGAGRAIVASSTRPASPSASTSSVSASARASALHRAALRLARACRSPWPGHRGQAMPGQKRPGGCPLAPGRRTGRPGRRRDRARGREAPDGLLQQRRARRPRRSPVGAEATPRPPPPWSARAGNGRCRRPRSSSMEATPRSSAPDTTLAAAWSPSAAAASRTGAPELRRCGRPGARRHQGRSAATRTASAKDLGTPSDEEQFLDQERHPVGRPLHPGDGVTGCLG